MTTSEAHNYENTALKCILRFLEYLCPITAAEWKESNENEDTVHLIYAFFISVIEVHSRLLVKGMLPPCSPDHEKFSILFINEMLNCTNKPGYYVIQESSSILALGFWYLLQVNQKYFLMLILHTLTRSINHFFVCYIVYF